MRKTEIRVETADTFFKRGRRLARLADRGERIPATRVVAFEDVGALLGEARPRAERREDGSRPTQRSGQKN